MKAMNNTAKIGLIVDCERERSALRALFDGCLDLDVAQEAGSVREARDIARASELDLVLVDMAGTGLLEVCRRLRDAQVEVPILALGSCSELASFARASGATRYEVRGKRNLDSVVRDLVH